MYLLWSISLHVSLCCFFYFVDLVYLFIWAFCCFCCFLLLLFFILFGLAVVIMLSMLIGLFLTYVSVCLQSQTIYMVHKAEECITQGTSLMLFTDRSCNVASRNRNVLSLPCGDSSYCVTQSRFLFTLISSH